jgi:hypothetical protein
VSGAPRVSRSAGALAEAAGDGEFLVLDSELGYSGISANGCTADSGPGRNFGPAGTGPPAPVWPDPSDLSCDPVSGKLSDMHPPVPADYRLLGGELLNNLIPLFAQEFRQRQQA